jgi:hypothetical protein
MKKKHSTTAAATSAQVKKEASLISPLWFCKTNLKCSSGEECKCCSHNKCTSEEGLQYCSCSLMQKGKSSELHEYTQVITQEKLS